MVAIIGRAKTGKLLRVLRPVKPSAVYDAAADRRAVSVHILCGRMRDDIRTPLKGAAVNRRSEGVINDERNAVRVCRLSESFNIKHGKRRVCDRLAKDRFCVGAESSIQLFVRAVGRNKGKVDAHLLHRNREEVEGTAVNGGGCDHVVSTGSNVEYRIEVCGLTRRGQHSGSTALKLADLRGNEVIRRVLESGIKIAGSLKIKELSHILARRVFEGRALNDGNLSGLAVSGGITALHAFGFDFEVRHFSYLTFYSLYCL